MVTKSHMKNFISSIHTEPPKRGQPVYKLQDAWSQHVIYIGGSTVHVHVVKCILLQI